MNVESELLPDLLLQQFDESDDDVRISGEPLNFQEYGNVTVVPTVVDAAECSVDLSSHDPLFPYQRRQANLRVLSSEPVKTVPYVPLSHPFVERLIGSVRRELLDQTLFWNSLDLGRKLVSFRDYYNESRIHCR